MRIASLQPSITLTLQALDRLDALCAITRYCVEALPQLAHHNLPILQDSWSFDRPGNMEALLQSNPDLVLASVPYRLESLAAILKAGVPVLALAPHRLADIFSDIRLIASLVEATSKAEALLAHIDRIRRATYALASTADIRPLVYCEEWGKPLIHSQHWVAELVETAHARFLGGPGTHTTAESIGALAEADQPDVLLFAWCGAGNRVPLARVIEQRQWHHLKAVKNRRVYCIPDEYLNTPAPSILQGLACIAAATHPSLFGPNAALIQIDEIHRETLTPNDSASTL